ncbi:MAG: nuclear transport factor 2 family protein [Novosphingobium sp.]|nr:nuclear transport factor 2 family protein [Novosphingobium sp.]
MNARSYAQDRAEIEDLMARYLFAMDWADYDAYAEMFTEDGELEYARGTAKGRAAIGESVRAFKAAIGQIYTDSRGRPAILRHILAQTVIRVEGDRAFAVALWWEMANDGPGDKPKAGTFGTYEDELVRQDGRWLFSKRRILNEFLDGRATGETNPVLLLDQRAKACAR